MGEQQVTASERDRAFACVFLALHFDLESSVAKGAIEILCRALESAREEGRREQLRRDLG